MINRLIFSKRFKLLREVHNLSSSELAGLLKFKSKGSIGDLESGKALPLADSLSDITNLFGVSLDWLTGRTDKPYSHEILLKLEEELLQAIEEAATQENMRYFAISTFLVTGYPRYRDLAKRTEISLAVRANIVYLLNWFRYISNEFYILNHPLRSSVKSFNDCVKVINDHLSGQRGRRDRWRLCEEYHSILQDILIYDKNVDKPVFDISEQLPSNIETGDRDVTYNPDGEKFYSFSVEDTMQPDFMECTGITLSGHLKYTFGIFQDAESRKNRHFLYLDSFKNSAIYPYLFTGRGHIVFLALTSFINWKIGFQYNPYDPKNMDIIIDSPSDEEGWSKFVSIVMSDTSPSCRCILSADYCNFIKEYLMKSTSEKASYLSQFTCKNSWHFT